MADKTRREELEAAVPRPDAAMAQAIEEAERLLGDGVEGVGQGTTPDGQRSVTVMVDHLTSDLRVRIPGEIRGFPVQIVETGTFQTEA